MQIIHEGRLVYADDVNAMEQRAATGAVLLGLENMPSIAQLNELAGVEHVDNLGRGRYRLHGAGLNIEHIARRALAAGWGLTEISPQRQSLEQIFVQLTTADEPAAMHDEEEAA